MVSRIGQWTLDVQDAERMARFWSQALGYRTVPDRDSESVHLHPPAEAGPKAPTVWLRPAPGPRRARTATTPT